MAIKPVSGEIKSQELNDNFSYLDSKASAMAGGPKETFTSLAALQAKYPNGDSHVMLVTDANGANGYLYSWSGSAWIKGPLYQPQGIANNSITSAKMDENYKMSFMEPQALSYTFKKGFYSNYSLKFEANPQFNSIAQAVKFGEIYEVTTKRQDPTIPLVMFFKDADCMQYLSHIDGDLGVDYIKHAINVPNGAQGLGVSGRNTAELSLSKKIEINLNEIKNDLIYKNLIDDVITSNGYFHTADSQFVNNASYRTITTEKVSEGDTIYFSANASTATVATCVFWSAPGVKILTVGAGSIKVFNDEMATVPKGTTLVTVTSHVSVTPLLKIAKKFVAEEIIQKIEDIDKSREISNNHWFGKKIGWIGTSVPFGANATNSYAKEAADKLGFELVNMSVPGQAIHTTSNGMSLTYGSTVLSKAEYASQNITISNSPIPYVPGGAYNSYYRTWENIFTAENADIDLWVFDVVPNNNNFNTTDWEMFDRANWRYTDDSDFADHRSTFLGALLFLMDKMYALNPDARMVFVLGSAFSYSSGKDNLALIKNSYNIHVIDVWSKINTSPKSLLKIRSNDGTDNHPSTFGHEILGNMITNELLLIS